MMLNNSPRILPYITPGELNRPMPCPAVSPASQYLSA